MSARSILAACALLAAGCGSSPGAALKLPRPAALPRSASSKVVEIVMENKEAGDVLGSSSSPFVKRLARTGGVAVASFAIRHPSLPNYLALTSGSTHGIVSDCTGCHIAGPSLATQLDQAQISWKGYMEDLPSPCFEGAGAKGYAKKHNPFAYYDAVARSPRLCRRTVSFGALAADLRRGSLPTFSFVVPNLCDDTHDCGVETGDKALADLVPQLVRELGPHGFLVLTWDEGTSSRGCCGTARGGGRIATIVAGPDVRRGARDATPVDHYGVLRTIEDALGVPRLGGARDAAHGSLAGLFDRPPRIGR